MPVTDRTIRDLAAAAAAQRADGPTHVTRPIPHRYTDAVRDALTRDTVWGRLLERDRTITALVYDQLTGADRARAPEPGAVSDNVDRLLADIARAEPDSDRASGGDAHPGAHVLPRLPDLTGLAAYHNAGM